MPDSCFDLAELAALHGGGVSTVVPPFDIDLPPAYGSSVRPAFGYPFLCSTSVRAVLSSAPPTVFPHSLTPLVDHSLLDHSIVVRTRRPLDHCLVPTVSLVCINAYCPALPHSPECARQLLPALCSHHARCLPPCDSRAQSIIVLLDSDSTAILDGYVATLFLSPISRRP